MSLSQNTVVLISVILTCLSFCSKSFAVPIGTAAVLKADDNVYVMMMIFQPYRDENKNDGETLHRVKRQGGAGKFADASKMSATKVMRLYLQMFKNIVSKSPIGGSHPMSPESIKPVVKLFKHRIIGFFFPEVGDSKV